MPQVAVRINDKTYRMACDEGQEAHLLELAERFDRSIAELKGSFGEIGDQRLTIMAGIRVQDRLVELQRQCAELEAEAERLRAQVSDERTLAKRFEAMIRHMATISGKLGAQ